MNEREAANYFNRQEGLARSRQEQCPFCHAEPEARCEDRDGHQTAFVHPARAAAAGWQGDPYPLDEVHDPAGPSPYWLVQVTYVAGRPEHVVYGADYGTGLRRALAVTPHSFVINRLTWREAQARPEGSLPPPRPRLASTA